ncbi:hypothetical protein Tcan_02569 [Toxocara canis]|uniref:Uncharacterized protein n=1 Tax=Toxocara canis TaxID=6265 RepID=A0A0B2UIX9_TOXCA|nr:hypothetical protein Tcan_02569 [Toxocara canis]
MRMLLNADVAVVIQGARRGLEIWLPTQRAISYSLKSIEGHCKGDTVRGAMVWGLQNRNGVTKVLNDEIKLC